MQRVQSISGLFVKAISSAFMMGLLNVPSLAHVEYTVTGTTVVEMDYTKRRDPKYGNGCCGGQDCNILPIGSVTAEADGLRVILTLEQAKKINPTIEKGINALVIWSRVMDSPDLHFRGCIRDSYRHDERNGVLCLFAPPSS